MLRQLDDYLYDTSYDAEVQCCAELIIVARFDVCTCSAGVGRRGWRMFYATLCDMVLYLHKDERSVKQSLSFSTPANAVRVHHALATRATDYIKKQHVFRLQTADWSQSLFQAR